MTFSIIRHSPDKVMNAAIKPFRDALRRDAQSIRADGEVGTCSWSMIRTALGSSWGGRYQFWAAFRGVMAVP